MTWNWDTVENCIDCNWYDDTSQPDTFLYVFGDYWICAICAEERGSEYDARLGNDSAHEC